MKVVITRDDDGHVGFWPVKAFESLNKDNDGDWWCSNSNVIVEAGGYCLKGGYRLLGFTPRKGSMQVVDITVKRLKK